MGYTYCLITFFSGDKNIKIGKLGKINFKKGYYIYVGSGNLARIERHYKTKKKIKWHIDYLLKKSRIIGFALSKKKECDVASKLSKKFIPIEKFGCSDCTCKSHLFYSKTFKKIRNLLG